PRPRSSRARRARWREASHTASTTRGPTARAPRAAGPPSPRPYARGRNQRLSRSAARCPRNAVPPPTGRRRCGATPRNAARDDRSGASAGGCDRASAQSREGRPAAGPSAPCARQRRSRQGQVLQRVPMTKLSGTEFMAPSPPRGRGWGGAAVLLPAVAYIPTVTENEGGNRERSFDIYSRLLKDRIILIGRPMDDVVANLVVAQLIYLSADDPDKEIQIYVNSPGGSVTAGFAIYDTMQYVRSTISTVCIGRAASFGTVILMAGAKGRRAGASAAISAPAERITQSQASALCHITRASDTSTRSAGSACGEASTPPAIRIEAATAGSSRLLAASNTTTAARASEMITTP